MRVRGRVQAQATRLSCAPALRAIGVEAFALVGLGAVVIRGAFTAHAFALDADEVAQALVGILDAIVGLLLLSHTPNDIIFRQAIFSLRVATMIGRVPDAVLVTKGGLWIAPQVVRAVSSVRAARLAFCATHTILTMKTIGARILHALGARLPTPANRDALASSATVCCAHITIGAVTCVGATRPAGAVHARVGRAIRQRTRNAGPGAIARAALAHVSAFTGRRATLGPGIDWILALPVAALGEKACCVCGRIVVAPRSVATKRPFTQLASPVNTYRWRVALAIFVANAQALLLDAYESVFTIPNAGAFGALLTRVSNRARGTARAHEYSQSE